MEQEIIKQKTSIEDFDFMSKVTNEETRKTKINFQKFLNVSKNTMMSAGIVLAVGVSGIGGYKIYQSNIDSKIASAEKVVNASSMDKILTFIGKEKQANEKIYISNQLLINQYGQLKDVIEVLNKQQEVANYQTKNTQLYNTIAKNLNTDILSINTLYAANPKTRDEKIAAYLDTNNVSVAKKWEEAITTNQFIHVGNMMDLNKQIKDSLSNVEEVKKDILEQVQTRIKNGDFDLNAAQTQFSKEIVGQTQAQLNDLSQAKKELADLKNESVKNDDGSVTTTDPNAQNIITDKDLTDASNALNTYQNQAINQIGADRVKVEQLIAEAKQQQNSPQTNQPVINNGNNSNSNVVVVNRGPSFLDYYLMYSWMNATPTIHNTTINYPSGTSYNNYQTKTSNMNSGNYKKINIPKPNIYDMNNNNSYLNKQLEKGSTFGNHSFGKSNSALNTIQKIEKSKININEVRAKIAQSKLKIAQAKTVRANEMKKISTAKTNKYESMAIKSKASKTSSSFKSTRSSFGRSSSFGGSR